MLFREIVADNFCGGGGASEGIFLGTGRHVDIAINHDIDAIKMHQINHPNSKHYNESVWEVDPREAANGRPVALVWLSPDCKHFSKALGGVPVKKEIRGLAWVAVRWAATVRPRVIMLENVEEFKTWGPVLENGRPCPVNKGKTFKSFVNALKRQGYSVEWRELRACDYGAPTIRKRLFLIARCDGAAIKWPRPTHGDPKSDCVAKGRLLPWRTSAECIDWSIECNSVLGRKRMLAFNTLRRIAKGVQRYVIDSDDPFIIKVNHSSEDFRGQDINSPLQTITSKNGWGVVTPFITEHANASSQRNMPIDEPLRTICAGVKGGHFGIVTPFVARQFGNSVGHKIDEPSGTVTAGGGGKSQLVSAHVVKFRGQCTGHGAKDPFHTITAGGNHLGEVRSCILKYYGPNVGQSVNGPLHTVTTKDRFAKVDAEIQVEQLTDDQRYSAWWIARIMDYAGTEPDYVYPHPRRQFVRAVNGILIDIGMRMFEPRELFRAQGFRDSYVIDVDKDGRKISKAKQVARCGNAVPPVFSEALVRVNLPELILHNKQHEIIEQPQTIGVN
ncbi:DNA cytosine methyltransferase [Alteromonas gilva]|uniref:DNA (cytosine-5-)-methyltransferase n=1 Tax=Alteromonas gilva TaxID=2987522 RepID=A0ABT5L6W1_9ALTE|nr:DNA cytosine methyltransferase [Alteromonas gilva]MDC8832804.1 DNA cytosine methyltransferase [Alteromonas gilva]